MVTEINPAPRSFQGVMLSSTFNDLKGHRAALIEALRKEELYPIGMESYVPVPGDDVIPSSLQMVRMASAYIGLISHRYGQVIESTTQNPESFSVSRIEFEEAQRLDLPTLVFVMSDEHPIKKADVETDPIKAGKLAEYRERAKVGRIHVEFESTDDFTKKAIHAVAKLRRYLVQESPARIPQIVASYPSDPIPKPPAFYPEPPYIGSHTFVGRQTELEALSKWASPDEAHPILLFEAIGGTGKSMLTWEWTTRHAPRVRSDWAGRFWYSFYEKGAILADFCRRGLAYVTGQPLKIFYEKKTAELGELLLHHLQALPWLFVLDGLERVLVAYHRIDAAQLADEEAGMWDPIGQRDPCAAIRPEDDDLLRALAAAAPSKLLLTSRLVPRMLLSPSSQPLPDVLHIPLRGLCPADAEALFRSSGVSGTSENIRSYLQKHCDCHPLLTGVLAGLVNFYLPDRGNFDAWAADPRYGGRLNFSDLELVQKRNHILETALAALPETSRGLLATLALLSEAVDYETLSAISHLLPRELQNTVQDLERRGLLQYDAQDRRYDLHPVVRGIAASSLKSEDTVLYGQRVVKHFSQQAAHRPYNQAETLEDVRAGLNVVRSLLRMGQFREAYWAYRGDLANALIFNLEAHAEEIALLRSFFPDGWATLPQTLSQKAQSYLANSAAMALAKSGNLNEALTASGTALRADLSQNHWPGLRVKLSSVAVLVYSQNRFAQSERCCALALDLAALSEDQEQLFKARLELFRSLAERGQWVDADSLWLLLDPMGRDWSRAVYRPGDAEFDYALSRFWRGDLREENLSQADRLAQEGKNRSVIRDLHWLRGAWHVENGEWLMAAESLHEAVRMAREVRMVDTESEALLALMKFRLRHPMDPRQEAKRLAKAKKPFRRGIAELYLAIGDTETAREYASTAYKLAWADGEPYVYRYELERSYALLERLGAEIPILAPYNPKRYEKLPWEDEVIAAIERLRLGKPPRK